MQIRSKKITVAAIVVAILLALVSGLALILAEWTQLRGYIAYVNLRLINVEFLRYGS